MNNQQNNGVIIDLSWKFNGIVWKINGHPKKTLRFYDGGNPTHESTRKKKQSGLHILENVAVN